MPRQQRNNLPRSSPRTAQPGPLHSALNSVTTSRPARALRAHPRPALAGAVALVAAGTVAYVITLPAPHRVIQPAARARTYVPYTACLLTDDQGTAGTQAAPVWAGMQAASAKTSEQVSTLQILGPQTLQNATTALNTLALRGCDLILSAGPLPDQAAQAEAAHFPKIPILAVSIAEDSAQTPAATSGSSATAAQADHAATINSQANLTTITAPTPIAAQTAVTATLLEDYHGIE